MLLYILGAVHLLLG